MCLLRFACDLCSTLRQDSWCALRPPLIPIRLLELILLPVSALFWLAWTSYPSISIASPILSLYLLGGVMFAIFQCCFSYIVRKTCS